MRRIGALTALALAVPLVSVDVASANDAPRLANVTAVSIVPAAGRANVVIAVSGAAQVSDFVLPSPDRIVVDITPARLGQVPAYDKISRAGIHNIRFTQYEQNVVRVVLDLDRRRSYQMSSDSTGVRISLEADGSAFSEWNSANSTSAATELFPTNIPGITLLPRTAESQQQLISVTYTGEDIKTVIANFAAFSGRTILPNNTIEGQIHGTISGHAWDVALQALLDVNGFAMTVEPSGIIKVDTYQNIFQRQQTERLEVRTFDVNYTRPGPLAETLRGMLYRDCSVGQTGVPQTMQPQTGSQIGQPAVPPGCIVRGHVVADTLASKLVLTEVSSRMDELIRMAQQLDVRTRQVTIRAKLVLVNRTSIEDIGISYDIGTASQFFNSKVQRIDPSTRTPVDINGDGVPDILGGGTPFNANTNIVNLGGNALSAITNASTNVLNPALRLIYSTAIGKFDLTTFLDLLQETRLADVQAEPSVTTLDNHEALIFMGERTPIRTVQPQTTANASPQTIVQFEETGITLRVTPHVTNNRQISMRISATRSSPEAGTSDIGLIFTKQNSENSLLVNDGETAYIGGININQRSISKTGIPILVDLPLIGKLFGQTTTREEKKELLILVTPHIVDDGSAGPGGGF
jgi:type IV pilus assembly protein PilQ